MQSDIIASDFAKEAQLLEFDQKLFIKDKDAIFPNG